MLPDKLQSSCSAQEERSLNNVARKVTRALFDKNSLILV